MTPETSYTAQGAGSAQSSGAPNETGAPEDYWPLSKLKKAYTDYIFSKRAELDEQIESRRYRHGSQYTAEQVATLTKRKQPIMTFNRTARKIDGIVGLIERLRQDPKAYARTPQHEEGAELATAALRYVLDAQEWKAKSPVCASDGAVDGIGGIALELEQGDQGDPDVGFDVVDITSFFYDPRSFKADFSDARYMGQGKWMEFDAAKEMFPDADETAFSGESTELVNNSDKDMRWFSDEKPHRVRIVECWYQHKGGWCWAFYTGSGILQEGKSYLKDEKGKDFCKFIMFSGIVDQDGDRYGFVRNLKSAQDGLNAKQSKLQHMVSSKRIIVRKGAVADIEITRREWARPDGVVETLGPVNEGAKPDDQSFDFAGLTKLLEFNLQEMESYGPNPQLIGQGSDNQSGRAIALMQQAGMAELGPYILSYKGWKIRVYRGIWNTVKTHWQAERWLRVTDDEGLAQYVHINALEKNEDTGAYEMTNVIGQLDVDIIMDEAPDAVTLQAQSFEILQALGPGFVERFPDIAVELSPLDNATKKKVRERTQQPSPQQQMAEQLQMAGAKAEVENTQADTQLKGAQAMKAMADAHAKPLEAMMSGQPMGQPQEYEVPPELQNMQAMADIHETQANTAHKQAQAFKAQQEAALSPWQMTMDQANAEADRKVTLQQAKQRAKAPA